MARCFGRAYFPASSVKWRLGAFGGESFVGVRVPSHLRNLPTHALLGRYWLRTDRAALTRPGVNGAVATIETFKRKDGSNRLGYPNLTQSALPHVVAHVEIPYRTPQ